MTIDNVVLQHRHWDAISMELNSRDGFSRRFSARVGQLDCQPPATRSGKVREALLQFLDCFAELRILVQRGVSGDYAAFQGRSARDFPDSPSWIDRHDAVICTEVVLNVLCHDMVID